MSKKTMRWLCLGAIVLAGLAGLIALWACQLRLRIEKDAVEQYQVLDTSQAHEYFAWELDYTIKQNGLLYSSGWLVEPGREYRGLNGGTGKDNVGVWNCVWIALLDEHSGTVYRLPTQAETPEENPYPADEIDHKNCAFYSEANVTNLVEKGANHLCLAVKTYEDGWYLVRTEVKLEV